MNSETIHMLFAWMEKRLSEPEKKLILSKYPKIFTPRKHATALNIDARIVKILKCLEENHVWVRP